MNQLSPSYKDGAYTNYASRSYSYNLDHVTPRSRGGDNSLDNLGITTPIANKSKTNLTTEEYLELCKKVLENNGYEIKKVEPKNK